MIDSQSSVTASVPVGISTGALFMPDVGNRLRAIEDWEILPDFASVNFHESGATDIARLLGDRGVGVEGGLRHDEAAAVCADSGLGDRCLRILIEPMEQTTEGRAPQRPTNRASAHRHPRERPSAPPRVRANGLADTR